MRTKSILYISLLFLSASAHAQVTYSNRWKETARATRQNKAVTFSDTMRITDVTKDSLKIRRGAFLYPGAINNDLLDMGYQQYQIIKLDSTQIKIGDDTYIYTLSREPKSADAAVISNNIKEMSLPQEPVKSIDQTLLNGKWEAYNRKKKDGSSGKINYKTLIKSASFSTVQNKITGSINTSGNDAPLYIIEKLENAKIIVSDANKSMHQLIVWKLTKEELVIEDEDGIMYYMKQF